MPAWPLGPDVGDLEGDPITERHCYRVPLTPRQLPGAHRRLQLRELGEGDKIERCGVRRLAGTGDVGAHVVVDTQLDHRNLLGARLLVIVPFHDERTAAIRKREAASRAPRCGGAPANFLAEAGE